jgi:hypothetical protein
MLIRIQQGPLFSNIGIFKQSATPILSPHTFRNVGSQDAHLLLTVIPGRFANYFIDVDGVDDDDHAAIKALVAKYDVEILE